PAWYPAIGIVIFQTVMTRLNGAILTYGLFRIASDIEKLPFPLAPIGAQGITALAEQQSDESSRGDADQKDNWRWRVFSIGGVLGLSFGTIYMALPAISAALLNKPISIIPIPFVEFTDKTSSFLPAVPTGISLNLGQFVLGMVLPFFAVLGTFLAYVFMAIANPILYHFGYLPSWNATDGTIMTQFHNFIDIYFSLGIGLAAAIAIAGIWQTYRSLRAKAKTRKLQQSMRLEIEADDSIPKDRGDIRPKWIVLTYLVTSAAYILLSGYLIDWHRGVMLVLLFFAFLYTPLLSYVTARLEGMAGQIVQIPYVREMAFILSGYQGGVKVWFLPIPMTDYGRRTVFYRQAELTGTRFWSIWKAELLLVPIVLIAAILFAQFIWSLNPIPGPEYPYAETLWELNAAARSIMYTATLGRHSAFQEAFRPDYIAWGAGIGVGLFMIMGLLHMPIMLIFGLIKGLNQAMLPHVAPTQFIGALVGRYYFQRKMGLKWRQYVPVVAAGFACGMGLVTVLGVGVNFLAKAVIKIPF
ncbi:MAG: OPT/YSL family transporter, partial [Phycisphaerae bacterium]|nr:OPT/YSL family transporter [Phycisphaerae bacterium]